MKLSPDTIFLARVCELVNVLRSPVIDPLASNRKMTSACAVQPIGKK